MNRIARYLNKPNHADVTTMADIRELWDRAQATQDPNDLYEGKQAAYHLDGMLGACKVWMCRTR
jgi:hypothetical protein